VGWEDDDVPGVYEGEKGTDIPECSEARVDEGASAGNESISTSREVSARAVLLISTSYRVNSASIHRISVENGGVTSISLAGSQGTPE